MFPTKNIKTLLQQVLLVQCECLVDVEFSEIATFWYGIDVISYSVV